MSNEAGDAAIVEFLRNQQLMLLNQARALRTQLLLTKASNQLSIQVQDMLYKELLATAAAIQPEKEVVPNVGFDYSRV